MMAPTLTSDHLTEVLSHAVQDRNLAAYHNSFALTIYWELDDTNVTEDVTHFQAILSTLNLNAAEAFIIGKDDRTPLWTLMGKLNSIFARVAQSLSKSIVFIHYAGHGKVEHGQLFAVESGTGRKLFFSHLIDTVCMQNLPLANMDTVFVLDCCYSHVVTRAPSSESRTVEIISATDDSSPYAFVPPRNTLTGKLRDEIARRKRDGHQFMRLSDVMAKIRADSPMVKPTNHITLGSSVCIPFNGVRHIDPDTIRPPLRAVFAVHLSENMSEEQLERLIQWIQSLPPSHDMELEGVYHTNSTLLIIQSAYALFSELAGYENVKSISEVSTTNLRQTLGQKKLQQSPIPPAPALKENVP